MESYTVELFNPEDNIVYHVELNSKEEYNRALRDDAFASALLARAVQEAVEQRVCDEANVELDFDEIIIVEVQNRPALYDHTRAEKGRSQFNKDCLFAEIEEILKEMGFRVNKDEVKRRWKNIRDRYMKCRNEMYVPSGCGQQPPKNLYKYYNSLQFLNDSLTYRSTSSSISSPLHIETQLPSSPSCSNSNTRTPPPSSPSNPSTSTSVLKKTKSTGNFGEMESSILATLQSVNAAQPEDKYDIFGKRVAIGLRELQDEEKVGELEIQMLSLLHKAKFSKK